MERKRNLKNMIMEKLLKKEFMIGMEKEGNGHIMMMMIKYIAWMNMNMEIYLLKHIIKMI